MKVNMSKSTQTIPGEKIVNKGHPALEKKAREIKKEEIGSDELNKVIELMKSELASQDDGVAIAAPQVGESLRLFVVAPNAFHKNTKHFQTVYINPRILKASKSCSKNSFILHSERCPFFLIS